MRKCSRHIKQAMTNEARRQFVRKECFILPNEGTIFISGNNGLKNMKLFRDTVAEIVSSKTKRKGEAKKIPSEIGQKQKV